MPSQQSAPFRTRLILFVAASLAVFAAVLPLSAAAQAPAPAARSILNAPFKGVTAPGSTFDLVESVIDYSAGASSPAFTAQTPHYLSVIEGELTVDLHGHPEVVVAGKSVVAPAGSTVAISNEGTQAARLFASTLLAVGAVTDVHQLSADGVKVFATARRAMTNAPAVVDVIQMGAVYDVGYRTPDHVMNEFHLMLTLTGQIGYHYLDGGAEQYGPRLQAVMYEGRPGWMANDGDGLSSMVWTWVGTPGKPLSSPLAAPTPAPAAPNTGSGLAPANHDSPSSELGAGALVLAGAAAVGALVLRRQRRR